MMIYICVCVCVCVYVYHACSLCILNNYTVQILQIAAFTVQVFSYMHVV